MVGGGLTEGSELNADDASFFQDNFVCLVVCRGMSPEELRCQIR